MQQPRSDFLNPFEKGEMLETVRDVLDDTDIRTSITLKSLKDTTHDWEAGTQGRMSTDYTVNALRRTITAGEVAASEGTLQIGDRVYTIEQEDITNDLQAVDRIIDGADVLSVIDWEADALDWLYLVTARDVGA